MNDRINQSLRSRRKKSSIFRHLENNNLTTIKGKMFGDTSSVTSTLHLDNNHLIQLPYDAFDGVSVDTVTLDNNNLIVYPLLSNPNVRKM